jgi:hypothetical protein
MDATPMNLEDTIELLIRNPASRPEAFPYERTVRIYQFQAWIYFPELSMVELAGCCQLFDGASVQTTL